MSQTTYSFIVAIVLIIAVSFLLYAKAISADVFTGIIGAIIGYFFGQGVTTVMFRRKG
ncbi:MAG: hypothetical protein QXO47_10045 [Thermoproteota archaeon]